MDPEPLMESTGHRRALIAGGVAASVLVVAVGWWMLGEKAEPEPRSDAWTAPRIVAQAPRSAPPAAVASVAPAVGSGDARDEVQMCGGLWVKLKDDGEVDWQSVEAALSTEAFMAGTLEAMISGADERARAAALATTARVWRAGASLAPCKGDPACERESTAGARDAIARRDALAKLAQDSNDPLIYGWAVQACSGAVPDATGFCQVISPAQWARLDPSNAAPWISVAAKAQAENDTSTFEDALYRIASAERYDPGEYTLGSVLLEHVPAGESNLWGAFNLAAGGIGVSTAFAAIEAQTLLHFCRPQDVTQGRRRDSCDRIAEMLVKTSTSLVGLTVGREIGKRAAWNEPRIAQLEKEGQALQSELQRGGIGSDAASLTCEALQSRVDRVRESMAHGEIVVLRKRLAAAVPNTLASAMSRGPGVGALRR